MCLLPWLVLMLSSAATADTGTPKAQLLLGFRAGALGPGMGLSYGPAAGLSAELALRRTLALELSLEQSLHSGERGRASLTSAALALSHRIDVSVAVPYLGFSVRAGWLDAQPPSRLEGALALGILIPFGELWFCGAEAKYGYELSTGAFPVSSSFQLRFGYRSAEF